MSEKVAPRNVDGQIVCPPGFELRADGMCYLKTVASEIKEAAAHVVEAVEIIASDIKDAAEALLHKAEGEAETVVADVKSDVASKVESVETKIEDAKDAVESKIVETLGVKVETPPAEPPAPAGVSTATPAPEPSEAPVAPTPNEGGVAQNG